MGAKLSSQHNINKMNFRDPTTVIKVLKSRQELLRTVPRISNGKVRQVLKDVLDNDVLVLDKISKTRMNLNTRRSSARRSSPRRSSTKRNNKNNNRNNNTTNNRNNNRNRRNNTNDACNISDDDFEKLSSEEQNNLVEKC